MVPRFEFALTIGLLGAGVFSASETGLLAYSLTEPYQYQFGWFDRHGASIGNIGTPAPFTTFDLSPDAKRLIVTRAKIDRANVWLFDLDRNVPSQITFGRAFEFDPRWGPDGRRLAATSVSEAAGRRIVEIGLDGKESVLLDEKGNVFLDDWSRDGHLLLYHSASERRALPLVGDRTSIPVRRAPSAGIDQARFSADGRSIAYNCNESARTEVYVERFPPTGERWQVSTEGGVQPMWRRDGRELYYLGLDGTMFAVEIRGQTNIEPSVPRALFQAPVGAIRPNVEQYATVDGSRFLFLKPVERPPRPITVIVNWPATINGQRRR